MPIGTLSDMKGLTVFITDIRSCKSKEEERARINIELAKIRMKLKSQKIYTTYHKKKYICKLIFIFLMGHKIDFGAIEAVNLLSSTSYTEKKFAYMYLSIISISCELKKIIIKSIKNDFDFFANMNVVELGVQYIANEASLEMFIMFKDSLLILLYGTGTSESIKKSCCLALCAFIKKFPDVEIVLNALRITIILNGTDVDLTYSVVCLLEALISKNFQFCQSFLIHIINWLNKILTYRTDTFKNYMFYFVPAPWLTVKLLKYLQFFPFPDNQELGKKLDNVLVQLLSRSFEQLKSTKIQHYNIRLAITIETINVFIHYNNNPCELIRSANILASLLNFRESNFRYLALETFCSLSAYVNIKRHQNIILSTLSSEQDTSLKRKSINLLYNMSDSQNGNVIVSHFFTILPSIEYKLREDLVIKIAILSEKYTLNNYAENILRLISLAGDYVSEEVWFRLIQVVTNKKELQGQAVKIVFEALQANTCHDNMVRIGAYLLGEFGNLIAGDSRSSPIIQLNLLKTFFPLCSIYTQQVILTTFVKFCNLYPEIKEYVLEFFQSENLKRNSNVELQKRAVEYAKLLKVANSDLLAVLFEEMPLYSEENNALKIFSKQLHIKEKFENMSEKNETEKSYTSTFSLDRPTSPQIPLNDKSISKVSETMKSQSPESHVKEIFGITPVSSSFIRSNQILPQINSIYTNEYTDKIEVKKTNSSSIEKKLNNSEKFRNDYIIVDWFNEAPTKTTEAPSSFLNSRDDKGSTNDIISMASSKVLEKKDENKLVSSSYNSVISLSSLGISQMFPFNKSICKQNGFMYEDSLIQVGFKFFFQFNKCHFLLFYGNKCDNPFISFSSQLSNSNLQDRLKINMKHVNINIRSKQQIKQTIEIECLNEFNEQVEIELSFIHLSKRYNLTAVLPLTMNRFFQAISLDQHQFITKWNNLKFHSQVTLSATLSMKQVHISNRLLAFNLPTLPFVDNNPLNHVAAAVFHTSKALYLVMVKIEPDQTAKSYRVTVKSIKQEVASIICDLIKLIL